VVRLSASGRRSVSWNGDAWKSHALRWQNVAATWCPTDEQIVIRAEHVFVTASGNSYLHAVGASAAQIAWDQDACAFGGHTFIVMIRTLKLSSGGRARAIVGDPVVP